MEDNQQSKEKSMYHITQAQANAEKELIKQGFRFSNWIKADAEREEWEGCMVFIRKPRKFTTEYREIDPDGNIN